MADAVACEEKATEALNKGVAFIATKCESRH